MDYSLLCFNRQSAGFQMRYFFKKRFESTVKRKLLQKVYKSTIVNHSRLIGSYLHLEETCGGTMNGDRIGPVCTRVKRRRVRRRPVLDNWLSCEPTNPFQY